MNTQNYLKKEFVVDNMLSSNDDLIYSCENNDTFSVINMIPIQLTHNKNEIFIDCKCSIKNILIKNNNCLNFILNGNGQNLKTFKYNKIKNGMEINLLDNNPDDFFGIFCTTYNTHDSKNYINNNKYKSFQYINNFNVDNLKIYYPNKYNFSDDFIEIEITDIDDNVIIKKFYLNYYIATNLFNNSPLIKFQIQKIDKFADGFINVKINGCDYHTLQIDDNQDLYSIFLNKKKNICVNSYTNNNVFNQEKYLSDNAINNSLNLNFIDSFIIETHNCKIDKTYYFSYNTFDKKKWNLINSNNTNIINN